MAEESGTGAMLSIGALSRATGLAIETLRTWERRYGFPRPVRKESGHRVYPVDSVDRLRRIAVALARGHRAGEVVGASDAAIVKLLEMQPDVAPAPPLAADLTAALDPSGLLAVVERFDGAALTRTLNGEWGRLGPMAFLQHRVAPLVRAVGDAWESGRLEVRHEHFLSERVGDLLRAYRLPYEERARGPLVVLATLPGEVHALGLQMAALVVATSGCRVCYLGTETPVAELASVATDLAARAVGVSVSLGTRGARTNALLAKVRSLAPSRIAMLVGGAGAPKNLAGATIVHSLPELATWTATIGAAA